MHPGITDPVDHRGRVCGCIADLAQRPDDARSSRPHAAFHDGVEAVLRRQPGRGRAAALCERRYTPLVLAGLPDRVLGIDRLMGSVEGAESEVHLADGEATRIGLRGGPVP